MTLVLEYGSGLQVANAYVDVNFVTSYLTARQRQTESSWNTLSSVRKEAAIIAATSYIDSRWGPSFRGTRLTFYNGASAQGRLTLSGAASADDTLTVGGIKYTFVATLQDHVPNQILVGSSASEQIEYIVAALGAESDAAGVSHSRATTVSLYARGELEEGTTDTILLTALHEGVTGNDLPLTKSADNITVSHVFLNGADQGPQALEFPRSELYDRSGRLLRGLPLKLREATAEYAVRAAAAELYQDPTVDASGRAVTMLREKVGPIETATAYEDGAALSRLIRPYPAADRLLSEFVLEGGRLVR